VLRAGRRQDAIDALTDRVWKATVSKASLADYQARFNVLSTRLVGGQPVIHVYAESQPEAGFSKIAPDLEDVYFQRLRQHAQAA